jgi:hypothetical protein
MQWMLYNLLFALESQGLLWKVKGCFEINGCFGSDWLLKHLIVILEVNNCF